MTGHHSGKKPEKGRKQSGITLGKSKYVEAHLQSSQKQQHTEGQRHNSSNPGAGYSASLINTASKQVARKDVREELYLPSHSKRIKLGTAQELDLNETSTSENSPQVKHPRSPKVEIIKTKQEDSLIEKQIEAILQNETEFSSELAPVAGLENPPGPTALPFDNGETLTATSTSSEKAIPSMYSQQHSGESSSSADQNMYSEHFSDTEHAVGLTFDTDMLDLPTGVVSQPNSSGMNVSQTSVSNMDPNDDEESLDAQGPEFDMAGLEPGEVPVETMNIALEPGEVKPAMAWDPNYRKTKSHEASTSDNSAYGEKGEVQTDQEYSKSIIIILLLHWGIKRDCDGAFVIIIPSWADMGVNGLI